MVTSSYMCEHLADTCVRCMGLTTNDALSAMQNVPVTGSTGDTPLGEDSAVNVAALKEAAKLIPYTFEAIQIYS